MNPSEMLYHAILYITMTLDRGDVREWTLDILAEAQKACNCEWEMNRSLSMLKEMAERQACNG